MRYILDDNNYIKAISFGSIMECYGKECVEYTGSVPSGYSSLGEWASNAVIQAYYISEGELVYDAAKEAEIEATAAEEAAYNKPATEGYVKNDKVYQFAKEEYEKGLNLLDVYSLYHVKTNNCYATRGIGRIEATSTGIYSYTTFYTDELEIGKTYTLSFMGKRNGDGSTKLLIGDVVDTDNSTYASEWLGSELGQRVVTFTATTNILKLTPYINFGTYAEGMGAIIENLMLVEGSTALPYQEYNGKIIREKDLGVLLWENGNPNAQFHAQTITTSNMSGYRFIDIYYKPLYYSEGQTIIVQRYDSRNNGMTLYAGYCQSYEQYTVGRAMTRVSNTQIEISTAYRNQEEDDSRCIPIAIYGIKVGG